MLVTRGRNHLSSRFGGACVRLIHSVANRPSDPDNLRGPDNIETTHPTPRTHTRAAHKRSTHSSARPQGTSSVIAARLSRQSFTPLDHEGLKQLDSSTRRYSSSYHNPGISDTFQDDMADTESQHNHMDTGMDGGAEQVNPSDAAQRSKKVSGCLHNKRAWV